MRTKFLKGLIVILIMSLSFTKTYAQNVDIFFINGQYADTRDKLSNFIIPASSPGKGDDEIMIFFNSCLYRLNGDSLTTIDTLAHFRLDDYYNNEKLFAIRLYQDKQTAFIYSSKSNQTGQDTISLRLINFENPYKLIVYKFKDDLLYKYWSVYKNDSLFFVNKNVNGEKPSLIKRNITSQKSVQVAFDILNYYISDGYNGLGCDDLYGGWGTSTERIELTRKLVKNDTCFLINYTNTVYKLPMFANILKLDSTIDPITPNDSFISLTVSNNNMLVIPRRPKKINGERYCQFLIYNKASKQWGSKLLKGSYRAIRAFNQWITGNQTYIGKLGIDGKSVEGMAVPGKQFRNQGYTEYTSPADFRFSTLEIYPTGILYLYNIDTGNYIEWQATEEGQPQGDSEILLVKNNTVYYRVNDKIYKRTIISNSKVGERVLLVQDDRAPSIHWAFISPTSPNK